MSTPTLTLTAANRATLDTPCEYIKENKVAALSIIGCAGFMVSGLIGATHSTTNDAWINNMLIVMGSCAYFTGIVTALKHPDDLIMLAKSTIIPLVVTAICFVTFGELQNTQPGGSPYTRAATLMFGLAIAARLVQNFTAAAKYPRVARAAEFIHYVVAPVSSGLLVYNNLYTLFNTKAQNSADTAASITACGGATSLTFANLGGFVVVSAADEAAAFVFRQLVKCVEVCKEVVQGCASNTGNGNDTGVQAPSNRDGVVYVEVGGEEV